MGINFRSVAEESMVLSRLHNGNEKVETDDILDKVLTINDFDIAVSDSATYAVFTFDEMPGRFYNGGLILTKMVMAWIDGADGIDAAVEEYQKLKEKDRVKIRLKAGKAASSKNNLTLVELV